MRRSSRRKPRGGRARGQPERGRAAGRGARTSPGRSPAGVTRPRGRGAAAPLLVALLLAGAGAALVWLWAGGGPAPLVERTADQNVLLVTIDTLRADALGSYGGPAATPNLDRLAAAGIRFEFAHAHAVVTLPSHASILTGVYPFEHGIHDNSGYRLPDDSRTLATMLRAEGFATGAFVAAFPLDSRFGLDAGFDVYDDRFGHAEGPSDFTIAERPAEAVVAVARAWIESQRGPWFAWVHLFDPHAAYRPPPPFDARYAGSPYHGEVAYTDHALGPLLADAADGERPTLVVVTLRPRRRAGRARRAHPRPVRVRGDAQGAAYGRAARTRPCRPRGRRGRLGGAGPARRHRSLDSRRALPGGSGAARSFAPRPGGGRRRRRAAVVLRSAVRVAQPGLGAAARGPGGAGQVHRSAPAGALRPAGRSGGVGQPGRGRRGAGTGAGGAAGGPPGVRSVRPARRRDGGGRRAPAVARLPPGFGAREGELLGRGRPQAPRARRRGDPPRRGPVPERAGRARRLRSTAS